jgi:glycosidase
VATQEADPESLLHQLRHLIAVRKQSEIFGLGDFAWEVFEADKKVAAYTRNYDGKSLLILNNLSAKAVIGRLSAKSDTYTDMLTGKKYPAGNLTLEPYQFLWLMPG